MHPARRRSHPARAVVAGALAAALAGCGAGPGGRPTTGPGAPPAASPTAPGATTPAPGATAPARGVEASRPQVLVTGLRAPWGLAFLPDGEALLTERDTARLLRVPAGGGQPVELARFDDVDAAGEGGLMGLAISPTFTEDRLVYAYYTGAQDNRVVRFPLTDPAAREPVVTGIPKGRIHNGGRIAFGPDGHLYVGTGDAGDAGNAQDDRSLGGKVLRVTSSGEPVVGGSPVYSKGHRNVQGLAFDGDGRLYAVELGQNRFDEVNQVRQGSNGGWPHIEGPGDGDGRFLAPVVAWDPAQASPSGGAVVGDALYVAALRGERLWKVPLDGRGGAGEPEALLTGRFGRLRTPVAAPDGSLWVLTSNRDGRGEPEPGDDRVLRLPAR